MRAARSAQAGWAAKTAYNRSQILYRIAELMEGRRDQFIAEVVTSEGVSRPRATRIVDAAIDRWVWYAGWADKYPQVIGTVNPVAGSYFNFSVPEPTGVVGIIAPEESSLLGLVSRLAPVIVSGNAAVVIASQARPLPAVTLTEVLATSDVPGGVVNLITGLRSELVGHLAGHMDVNALDAFGAAASEARPSGELVRVFQSAEQEAGGSTDVLVQAIGQKAGNDQGAWSDAYSEQIAPSNANEPVAVVSPGDGGVVEQSNDSSAASAAGTRNTTCQRAKERTHRVQ